jgi:NitT/TauT family transport system substrate-binding protein
MTMRTRSGSGRRLARLAIWALAWALASPSTATAAEREKLVIGVTAVSGAAGGILAAQDHGLFREQGLDVEFVFVSTSTLALPALLSGQVALVTGVTGPAVVNATLAGADLVWLAEFLGTMPYTLLAAPAIHQVAELRGKRIGVSRLGSSSEFAARFMVARSGLDPARDVTVVQIGDFATRLAAISAGSIDATVMPPEAAVAVRRLGLREVADTRNLGLRYPQEGVVTTRAIVRTRPDTLRRFMRAVVVGTHRYRASRPEGLQLLAKYMKLPDDESVAATYDVYAPLTLAKPYVSPESIQFVLDEVAKTNARARGVKPEDLMEMRFVQELDQSGFLDRLYAR